MCLCSQTLPVSLSQAKQQAETADQAQERSQPHMLEQHWRQVLESATQLVLSTLIGELDFDFFATCDLLSWSDVRS